MVELSLADKNWFRNFYIIFTASETILILLLFKTNETLSLTVSGNNFLRILFIVFFFFFVAIIPHNDKGKFEEVLDGSGNLHLGIIGILFGRNVSSESDRSLHGILNLFTVISPEKQEIASLFVTDVMSCN